MKTLIALAILLQSPVAGAANLNAKKEIVMDTTYLNKTVAEIVLEQPGRFRVLEEFGIDYCCGGQRPLRSALDAKGIEPQTLLERLAAADAAREEVDTTDYLAFTLTELAGHIVDTHHVYLRTELPRINGLVEKVAKAHGDTPKADDLQKLAGTVQALTAELQAHLMKEEQILFPNIERLESGQPAMGLDGPIGVMMREHDSAGDALTAIRTLTDDYTLPEWGCNTYRAMLDALQELEQDLHQHIHKENNILFPRAQALAARTE